MQNKIETQSFLWLLLIVSIAFIWLLIPFFAAVFWAIAITIVFYPIYVKLLGKMPRWPNFSALLTLLLCVFIVVLPIVFTVSSVVGQGIDIYERVQSGEIDLGGLFEKITGAFPSLQIWLERWSVDINGLREKTVESAMSSGKVLAQGTWSAGQNVFSFLLNLAIMLYVAFFLLRDGDKLVALMIKALPLGDKRERLLFAKFSEVTRATIKGNLVIAIIQGALGGLIFWILDIPGFMLWGVVMATLSLIPAVGAGLVWGPVAIYMFAVGDWIQAVVLIAYGLLVIGLVDNVLRPILVGRDTKLPDYIVLLSTLGGLVLFGVHGFVIGPLIAALFTVFWGIFMREFQHEDTANSQHIITEDNASQRSSVE